MGKWDGLIKYLATTNAKPESVEALIKNTWKPKGKKTKVEKTGDFAIIKRAWVYTVCHAIYNMTDIKQIDKRINTWVTSESYKINYNIFHPVKIRNATTKKLEWAEDRKAFQKEKSDFKHYNAVKTIWNRNKKIRQMLKENNGLLDQTLLQDLMEKSK